MRVSLDEAQLKTKLSEFNEYVVRCSIVSYSCNEFKTCSSTVVIILKAAKICHP